MPTYEYECTKCKEQFEYFQSIKDAPKKVCEKCGGELTRLLSGGTGLIFKGSGFYITDYKGTAGQAKGEKGTEAAPAASSKAESKAEAAPVAAPKATESK